MELSGKYEFRDSNIDVLLKTSFQLCGIVPSEVSGWQAQAALLSLNLICSDIPNRGNNLWLSQSLMMPIVPNQTSYLLPPQVSYIKELTAVGIKKVEGIPFDGEINIKNKTICWKGIKSDTPFSVTYIIVKYTGVIQSNFNLKIECSSEKDPVEGSWVSIQSPYDTSLAGIKNPNDEFGIVVFNPLIAKSYRVNGFDEIQKLQVIVTFSNPTSSLLLSAISENEYYSIGSLSTFQPSSPSSFYLDRQIQPIIRLWPVPDGKVYNIFSYKATITPQDVVYLINTNQFPQRFLRAIVYELAAELSLQFAPDKYGQLSQVASYLFKNATVEDHERVPLRIATVRTRT